MFLLIQWILSSGFIQYMWDGALCIFRVTDYNILIHIILIFLKIISVLAYSADPDKMMCYASGPTYNASLELRKT